MPTKVVVFEKTPSLQRVENDGIVANFNKIVFWMRMIGIPLDPESIEPRWIRYVSTSFSWGCLFLNVSLNMWALASLRKPENTNLWNILISNINFAFGMTLAHAGLLVFVAPQWKNLTFILQQIDNLQLFRREDYKKCHKVCLYGRVAFVLMVGIEFT